MSRTFPGFIPAGTDASSFQWSVPLSIGDNTNFYMQVLFSGGTPTSDTGLSWTASGTGPYVVEVTVADTTGFPESLTVSNGSDPAVDGVQDITVTSATMFEFTIAADPGASGTLDIDYILSDLAGTLSLESSMDGVDPDGWFPIPSSNQAVTTGTRHAWNVSEAHYPFVRIAWAYASGAGEISAKANINEQMIAKGA